MVLVSIRSVLKTLVVMTIVDFTLRLTANITTMNVLQHTSEDEENVITRARDFFRRGAKRLQEGRTFVISRHHQSIYN